MTCHPLGRFCTLGLLVLSICGCGRSSYELQLVPEGDALSRTLVYSEHRPAGDEGQNQEQPPSDEVLRLAEVFGTEVPRTTDGNVYRFQGTFTGTMPDDVGGVGRFERRQTSLGSLCIYIERFRGGYELAQNLETRFEKVETLASLLADWVRIAGKESPLRDRLERLVRENLKQDLKNVVLVSVAMGNTDPLDDNHRLWMQLAQFSAERGYIDLDVVLRGISGGPSEANTLDMFRQALMRKLQLENESELLRTWPALASPEAFIASLDDVIEGTKPYQQDARQRAEKHDQKSPSGSEFLGILLMEILGIELVPGDTLTVYLQCPSEPVTTNGIWVAEDTRVRWEMPIPSREFSRSTSVPDLCYAIWSEADREFQQQHFGEVLLEGKPLATYCAWRISLKREEGDQWDRFLASLSNREDRIEALFQFQFSEAEESQSPAAQQLENIRELFRTDDGDETRREAREEAPE